jgi:hypothetical protein
MTNEALAFYTVRKTERDPHLSNKQLFDKVYEQSMNNQKSWHENHGKYGFGSEKTHEDMFELKAKQAAQSAIKNRKVLLDTLTVPVSDETHTSVKKRIEALSNFSMWIIEPIVAIHFGNKDTYPNGSICKVINLRH